MSNFRSKSIGLIGLAVLVALCPVPVTVPGADTIAGARIAHADDDDDDDGGSGRSGSRSGSGSAMSGQRGPGLFNLLFERRQRPRARRQQAAMPRMAPREIVALGLSDASIGRLSQAGFTIEARTTSLLAGTGLVKLRIPAGLTLEAARQAVITEAPEASVDFNHFYDPQQAPAAACMGPDCVLVRNLVGWPAERAHACGTGLRIGLIDTAINREHAALINARIEVIRLEDGDLPESGKQHGTAVAALLVGASGGRAPGLLPHGDLITIDAFHRAGRNTDRAAVYDLVRALDILAGRQVPIVNMSLSGPANVLLEKVVGAATERGMILVAAGGNEGPRAKPVYPAGYGDVIAVTAVDRSLKPYRRAIQGEHIDIAAPGVGVWTAASVSGARTKSGTSFAAPFVTAAAAILKASRPDLTPEEIEAELMRTARDLGEPGKDKVYGWGLLDASTLCRPG